MKNMFNSSAAYHCCPVIS